MEVVPSSEPRSELLSWLNSQLPDHIPPLRKIEQCGSGVPFVVLLPYLIPSEFQRLTQSARVKVPATHEYEMVSNLKVLQETLQKHNINRPNVLDDPTKLIKGNFQANLSLLQWFKGFADHVMMVNNNNNDNNTDILEEPVPHAGGGKGGKGGGSTAAGGGGTTRRAATPNTSASHVNGIAAKPTPRSGGALSSKQSLSNTTGGLPSRGQSISMPGTATARVPQARNSREAQILAMNTSSHNATPLTTINTNHSSPTTDSAATGGGKGKKDGTPTSVSVSGRKTQVGGSAAAAGSGAGRGAGGTPTSTPTSSSGAVALKKSGTISEQQSGAALGASAAARRTPLGTATGAARAGSVGTTKSASGAVRSKTPGSKSAAATPAVAASPASPTHEGKASTPNAGGYSIISAGTPPPPSPSVSATSRKVSSGPAESGVHTPRSAPKRTAPGPAATTTTGTARSGVVTPPHSSVARAKSAGARTRLHVNPAAGLPERGTIGGSNGGLGSGRAGTPNHSAAPTRRPAMGGIGQVERLAGTHPAPPHSSTSTFTPIVDLMDEEATEAVLAQTATERQFYYDKLRMIERLVVNVAAKDLRGSDVAAVALARSIRDVLYATN